MNTQIKEPTVIIVDDDVEWCKSLQWLLESVNLKTKIYHSGPSFLKDYNPQAYGCLLIDIRMPEMTGLQLQEKLNELGNKIPIIIISGHADVQLAVRAMKAGAFDLITKPFNEQHLLEQIYKAIKINEKTSVSATEKNITNLYNQLTTRERQIMEFIIEGRLNKQIAIDLNISIKTVELHRSNLMHKLNARTLGELFKIYFLHHAQETNSKIF